MYTNLFARFLLVIGGINYLFLSLDINPLYGIKRYPIVIKTIFVLIGLSALYFIFDRDFYLPFLGKCVIPVGPKKSTENLKKIKLSGLPPNSYVLYWGAKPNKSSTDVFTNPLDAYKDYSNSDIGKTDMNGDIIIELECPSEYIVSKFGVPKKLNRHIHYRFELPEYKGIFSKVYTKELDVNCQ
jgi:uncharacterized membrane protein YuzA (DUF378 family)